MPDYINPARVTPTVGPYWVTGVQPVHCRLCGGVIERPEYTPAPHDAHGVCIIEAGRVREPRTHVYTLHYHGAQEDETVTATGPSQAVDARAGGPGSLLPSGITDETVMKTWVARLRTTPEVGLTDMR